MPHLHTLHPHHTILQVISTLDPIHLHHTKVELWTNAG
ncbi:hypothetical protein SLEP1_g14177 [Rubroshorea leprosula]|uniref:Uncharacterized protein n=1 Tax=Rubroshorea leprosula TaxID=152421 RepID=A0AAV5IS15_9ROSI|nr:hypothetical protein SLEP1_g14177 [Rubroshorea leprosula]